MPMVLLQASKLTDHYLNSFNGSRNANYVLFSEKVSQDLPHPYLCNKATQTDIVVSTDTERKLFFDFMVNFYQEHICLLKICFHF